MEEYYGLLLGQPLFAGLSEQQLANVIQALKIKAVFFAKDKIILEEGGKSGQIGLVLQGSVFVFKHDTKGNRNIVAKLSAGELFAEVFAAAGAKTLPLGVAAKEGCRVAFINLKSLLELESRLAKIMCFNLINILAQKSIMLNKKNEILCKRETAEKIMEFMRQHAPPGRWFAPGLNRQQLADYICAERSAMTTVLFQLKKQGRINFEKNKFVWYLPRPC